MRLATKFYNNSKLLIPDTCCEARRRSYRIPSLSKRASSPIPPRVTAPSRCGPRAIDSLVRKQSTIASDRQHHIDSSTLWPAVWFRRAAIKLDLSAVYHGLRFTLVMLFALALHNPVFAIGAGAGTNISNTAMVDYAIAGTTSSSTSNTVTIRVQEKLDVNVSWLDAANVGVNTPDTNQVLSYLLTNTGNGNDSYTLSVQNSLGGDQFDPVFGDIYLDANDNGMFDPGVDILYVAGMNDPSLDADASRTILVRNHMPGALNTGDLGNSQLIATSNTGSGLPGTAYAASGDNNTTAVVGASGGTGSATGSYEVTGTAVSLLKSVVISDPSGGNQPVPGATMTYRIDASVIGPGTASNVVITDPLPANITYDAGTLTLNTAALTDGVDVDAGDVGGTTPNTVTVSLGDLTPASPVQSITFEVTIN